MNTMKFYETTIEVPRKKESEEEYIKYLMEHLRNYWPIPEFKQDDNKSREENQKAQTEELKAYYDVLCQRAIELSKIVNDVEVKNNNLDEKKVVEMEDVPEVEIEEKLGFFQRIKNFFRAKKEDDFYDEEKLEDKKSDEKETKEEDIEMEDVAELPVEKKPGFFQRIKNFFKKDRKKNKKKNSNRVNKMDDVIDLDKIDISDIDIEEPENPEIEAPKVEPEEVIDDTKLIEIENNYSKMLDELRALREEIIGYKKEQEEIFNIKGVKELVENGRKLKKAINDSILDDEKANNRKAKMEVEEYVKSITYPERKVEIKEENTREQHQDLYDFYVRFWNQPEVSNALDLSEKTFKNKQKVKTR